VVLVRIDVRDDGSLLGRDGLRLRRSQDGYERNEGHEEKHSGAALLHVRHVLPSLRSKSARASSPRADARSAAVRPWNPGGPVPGIDRSAPASTSARATAAWPLITASISALK